ncbi:hypothetical protein Dimus_039547 [Dionaea muscipula]
MRAVISPYHLMLKFPARGKVGKMFGDQETARRCYLVSLDSKAKPGDKTDSDDDETPRGIHCVEDPPEERYPLAGSEDQERPGLKHSISLFTRVGVNPRISTPERNPVKMAVVASSLLSLGI